MNFEQAFNELYEVVKQEGMSEEFSKELIVYKAEELKRKMETADYEQDTGEEQNSSHSLKTLDDAKITGN